jgi:hypothetical protein
MSNFIGGTLVGATIAMLCAFWFQWVSWSDERARAAIAAQVCMSYEAAYRNVRTGEVLCLTGSNRHGRRQ